MEDIDFIGVRKEEETKDLPYLEEEVPSTEEIVEFLIEEERRKLNPNKLLPMAS